MSGSVAHQFDTAEQQTEAITLGMWAFLLTEIMLFAAIFCAYGVYRWLYPTAFAAGSHHLSVLLGGFNTAVLLTSSLTMALGVRTAKLGRNKATVQWIFWTLVLGAVFLGVKAVEYAGKFEDHLIPGAGFVWHGIGHPNHVQIFYLLYFTMTGLHAFHMVIGIGLLSWLIVRSKRKPYTPHTFAPVEVCGLYWHLIDIIWIFLFPLLYLLGRH